MVAARISGLLSESGLLIEVGIFPPSNVAFLSSPWTKLAEIWVISPKDFLQNLSTDGQDNATFEAKKCKPKLKGRTLFIVCGAFLPEMTKKLPYSAKSSRASLIDWLNRASFEEEGGEADFISS